MKKVIITGNIGVVTPEVFNRYKEYIEGKNPDIDLVFLSDLPISEDELIEKAKGATVIVSQFQQMNDKIYKALKPELIGFVSHGIGTNAANVSVATENEILVSNVPDYCIEEVANHTVAMILSSYRKIPEMVEYVNSGKWGMAHLEMEDTKRFSEYTIGLYGFGNIPKLVAKMVSGFGNRIISNDPFISKEQMAEYNVESVSFDKLLEESDILSIHAPLLPDTKGVFNSEAFKKMKKNSILVNTARGGLINPQDLYDALTNGEIAYAALDVLINEPPSGIEKEIINLKNTMVTPHIAYYSKTAFDELTRKVADSVLDICSGKLPKYVVNKDVVDKLDWINK